MEHGIYPNGLKKIQVTLDTGEVFHLTNGPAPIADNLSDLIAACNGEKGDLPIEAQQLYRRANGFVAQCGEESFSWTRPVIPCLSR